MYLVADKCVCNFLWKFKSKSCLWSSLAPSRTCNSTTMCRPVTVSNVVNTGRVGPRRSGRIPDSVIKWTTNCRLFGHSGRTYLSRQSRSRHLTYRRVNLYEFLRQTVERRPLHGACVWSTGCHLSKMLRYDLYRTRGANSQRPLIHRQNNLFAHFDTTLTILLECRPITYFKAMRPCRHIGLNSTRFWVVNLHS